MPEYETYLEKEKCKVSMDKKGQLRIKDCEIIELNSQDLNNVRVIKNYLKKHGEN